VPASRIIEQLDGIGGGRAMGFGQGRVRSLPDGVAQALNEYIEVSANATPVTYAPLQIEVTNGAQPTATKQIVAGNGAPAKSSNTIKAGMIVGDLCPECGEASVINEEGCRKCYSCGYSEC
jgi:ribonucleoside-diphosphate reductase alpha chain